MDCLGRESPPENPSREGRRLLACWCSGLEVKCDRSSQKKEDDEDTRSLEGSDRRRSESRSKEEEHGDSF